MNKPIVFKWMDGPVEKPNGWLLVTPVSQGKQRNFFVCQVVEVLKASGRIAKVGDTIETEGSKLELYWRE